MNIEDLKIGSTYSNDEICKAFSCSLYSGMNKSNTTNTLVLVANHVKSIYEDTWNNNIMYYTGMGRKGDQNLKGNQNITLYDSDINGIDVHFFEVLTNKIYTYQGQVVLAGEPAQEFQDDEDGNNRKVWIFPLKRKDNTIPVVPKEELDKAFNKKIRKASILRMEELREKAKNRSPKPGKRQTTATTYQRNEYVIMYVLRRANGICELCKGDAPFKKKNGNHYLEVHHIVRLADDGDDTIENAVALCPNCHRKMHSLELKSDIKKLQSIEN